MKINKESHNLGKVCTLDTSTPIVKLLPDFLVDKEEHEAFLTGSSGTGKTTETEQIVQRLLDMKIPFLVVAYTHTAKDVLKAKIPQAVDSITTLHSFLKKRPTINQRATENHNIMISRQYGKPETIRVLLVDEASFIGTKDYMSLTDLQESQLRYLCSNKGCDVELSEDMLEKQGNYNCPECGKIDSIEEVDGADTEELKKYGITGDFTPLKIIYIGDPNQLNPVGDVQAVVPHAPYWQHLTKVWRIKSDSDLGSIVDRLSLMVSSSDVDLSWLPNAMEDSRNTTVYNCEESFYKAYKDNKSESKKLVAFTRQAVQKHSNSILGMNEPTPTMEINIPTLRTKAIVVNPDVPIFQVQEIKIPQADATLTRATKFNPMRTIETLMDEFPIRIMEVVLDGGTQCYIACVFGTYNYKIVKGKLDNRLTSLNRGSKDSKIAYKFLKTFSDYVCQADFTVGITIHSTQGGEWDDIYIDYDDVVKKNIDISNTVRMLFVAFGRATTNLHILKRG